jgi:hypothetical protein
LRGDYDTNALLLPGTPSSIALPSPEGDVALFLDAGVRVRPVPSVDLTLHDDFVYRKQHEVVELDLLGNLAGVDYRWSAGAHALSTGYQFEYFRLAGDPYLQAHRLAVGYEHRLSEALRLAASFSLLVRRFQQPAYDPFTGEGYLWRLGALWWGPPAPFLLEAGYAPALEVTRERDLGFHGHTFFATFAWQPFARVTVAAGAELALRFFLAADEVLGTTRREVQPLLWASVSLRAARPWRLLLSLSYTHNAASPSFYEYDRLVVSLASVLELDAF